jgi:hypothetical protein
VNHVVGLPGGVVMSWVGEGADRRDCTPDLSVLTARAKQCADTTMVDSSQRSHEAAQEQVHREHGGRGTVSMEVGVTRIVRITESDS